MPDGRAHCVIRVGACSSGNQAACPHVTSCFAWVGNIWNAMLLSALQYTRNPCQPRSMALADATGSRSVSDGMW
jgi:hypothetical protein